ncbi:hypothetical protein G6F27_014264 [Rhizopus arrhizus]|nr:hypothetical protein G6F27_014264 [Rhizopus arrhizus]
MERDQWVEAMKQYVDHDNLGQKPSSSNQQQPIDYRQQLNKYLQRSRSDASSLKKKRKDSNQQRHARQRSSLDENVMREISEHQHQNDNTAMEEKNSGKSLI